jgi:hypothetical protein
MPGSPIKNDRPRVRKECRYPTAVRQMRLRAEPESSDGPAIKRRYGQRAVLYRKAEPEVPQGLWLTHFGFERDVAEALALAGDEGGKIGNRSAGRLDAGRRQLLYHLGRFQRGLQLGIHLVDDRLRRATRGQQSGPMADLDCRITLLGGGGFPNRPGARPPAIPLSTLHRRHGDFHAGAGGPACRAHGSIQLADQPLHDAAAETRSAGGLVVGLKSFAVVGKGEAMVGSDCFHRDPNIAGLSDVERMLAGVQHQFGDQQRQQHRPLAA